MVRDWSALILPCAAGALPATKEPALNRLFRQPDRGVMGYAALAVFAAAYLFAMMLIVAPKQMLPAPAAAVSENIQPTE